jgi:hypothetical protein
MTSTKICYIILTCERFLPTRATWLRENAFKNTNPSDYYFLSCKPGPHSVYGWDTADDYNSCPWKYIEFFKNLDLDYDWYVFLDDDAFVFPDRYRANLSQLDHTKKLYIGCQMGHLENLVFMSGGATFTISRPTYNLIKHYIRTSNMHDVQQCRSSHMNHGDVSIGQWITNINNNIDAMDNQITLLQSPFMISYNPHENDHQLQTSSSFHYLKQKEQYELYGTYC